METQRRSAMRDLGKSQKNADRLWGRYDRYRKAPRQKRGQQLGKLQVETTTVVWDPVVCRPIRDGA